MDTRRQPSDVDDGPADVVLPPRLADRELALLSLVATLGAPLDAGVAQLVIESFFPADAATARFLPGEMMRTFARFDRGACGDS
jgi:hypothetical protein